jgi:hypothetical protein
MNDVCFKYKISRGMSQDISCIFSGTVECNDSYLVEEYENTNGNITNCTTTDVIISNMISGPDYLLENTKKMYPLGSDTEICASTSDSNKCYLYFSSASRLTVSVSITASMILLANLIINF